MNMITGRDITLVVVDVQEKLMPVMSGKEELEEKLTRFVKGMKTLGIPAVVTQQYTKGIGETIPSISEALGDFEHVEKTSFGCMKNDEFRARIEEAGNKTVAVCGVEAHICVQQTVLQLLDEGYDVYLVVDCIGLKKRRGQGMGSGQNGRSGSCDNHIRIGALRDNGRFKS